MGHRRCAHRALGYPARAAPAPSVDLAAARAGVARARAWWDPHRGWYDQYLPGTGHTWTATLWGIVHLFGAYNAIAIADPSRANVAAARRFATGAERYWNPDLGPCPATAPRPRAGRGAPGTTTRPGGASRSSTPTARRTTAASSPTRPARCGSSTPAGTRSPGGICWNTCHTFKASESLAGATLTAAGLYEVTHRPRYLALARKYIAWADRTIRAPDGLYGARSSPRRPMPYVEGPMAEAFLRLCHATGRQAYCRKGEHLLRVTAARFPTLTMGPQYDAIYLRSAARGLPDGPRPALVPDRAAVGRRGDGPRRAATACYLRTWDGRPIGAIGTPADKLQTHAATTSVLAWLAAAKPGQG